MNPLCSCGQFHDPCAADLRLTALAKATREDQRVIAASAAVGDAWTAYAAGRDLPLRDRDELEQKWRAASRAAGAVATAVWAEKRAELDNIARL